ncbi:unnamed protein product [Rotaria sordida]|uniref:FLYWCH-type domain-containing protein n=1 Tax=Rotaria sordida TaxID=392033 RepID=A0A814ZI74_9BILA|nr:unnamed protein product [Rotaria sordida]CAF1242241.1 unnamed protein product [Rotaria sordida]CAF4137888.1 unnamed protein product [Rotaria sordida]CAF4184923.1 unnamed protein product [Rotaria sordida]
MPVTTRAAALRSQSSVNVTPSLDQTMSTSTSISKTTRKCPSKQKHKQVKVQPVVTCDEFEVCPAPPQQQSTILDTESIPEVIKLSEGEENKLAKEMDAPLENLFADEPSVSSSLNKNSESIVLSPTSTSAPHSPVTITKLKDGHSIISLESSNNDESDIEGDSNAFMNVPIIKGSITTGTSTRGGKMVFMNGFGYLYMSTAKKSIGWRCVRRDMNCKAVIHTSKITGEFSHWNGTFHCHAPDLFETRKRNILAKIKSRVRDEYIPIKIIIEEEYRKASLSVEEKRVMPLPCQIGT